MWRRLLNYIWCGLEEYDVCDILLRGGKVLYIGDHPTLPLVPKYAKRPSSTIRYIIPGLIDARPHLIRGGGQNSPQFANI